MPLYYTITIECHLCRHRFDWAVVAEAEPPAHTMITIPCPNHGGPLPVPVQLFRRVDELPPGLEAHPHLPPPPPPPVGRRWWEFWKR